TVQIPLTTDLLNNFEDVYFSYLNFARIIPILQNGGTLGDLASYNTIIKLDVCVTPIVDVPENPIVLPTIPQLTITSATCPDKNSATVTVSVQDGRAINTALADIYTKLGITEQMLGLFFSRFSGGDSLVVTLTKDAPATSIMGFGTLGFATFSGSGESVVAVPILYLAYDNFPIYANLPNPYVVYDYLMTQLTPLVEKYNRGEYIFNADYDAFVANLNNAPSNLLSSRMSSLLIENCDIARTPISLTVTESCDFETGINTVTLTLDASDMVAFLQSFPTGGESYVNFYDIDYAFHSGETGTIGLLDGTITVDVQTRGYPQGVYVTYTNPDTINYAIQISLMGISDVVVGEAEITRQLQVCDVEITPEATVDVEPTLNMGIEAYCQYFYTQPTAVFVLSNPNEITINASYTDQDGDSFPFSIPSNGTLYEYITPNEQGVASIKIDGATNFAQVTNCFTAQLSVTRADCVVLDGMYFVEFDIYNSGPGTVQSGIHWQTFGLETLSGYFNYLGGDTLTPNESLLIRAQPDAQGFLRVVVSDYNFSYTNPVPCLEGAPTAEVTPTAEITPIVTPTAEVTPEVIT
ncbi:MAG TPA: hypothetical protein PLZ51_10545, partial [Aggregatilineales bacterium]|nr:hypothetical protein [Aggregatilineales bacterium]